MMKVLDETKCENLYIFFILIEDVTRNFRLVFIIF